MNALEAIYAEQDKYITALRRVYADAEQTLIRKVSRRIERGIDTINDPGWAERKLAEVRALRKEIIGELEHLRELDPEVADSIESAWKAGADRAAEDILRTGISVVRPDMMQTQAGTTQLQKLLQAAQQAQESVRYQILRTTQDAYRDVILRASTHAATGADTRRQAAQQALNDFGDRGITGFVAKNGARWDMASYIEVATRTTLNNAARQAHDDQLTAHGYDLRLISDSSEACDVCIPWEGQIVSASGDSAEYPSLADAEADGLFHPNCAHSADIYVPGVSEQPEVRSVEERQDNYKEREQQRYNERGIRKWKNREAAAIDDTKRKSANAKVKEWQARQREFINDTGRRRDYGRESITKAR
jgi:hypothetical protein